MPEVLEHMEILDCSGFLTQDDFFILDGHLNASGHAKVARALKEALMDIKGKGEINGPDTGV